MAPVRKKNEPKAIGKCRGGWSTKVHMVAASTRCAIGLSISLGQAGAAPEGRALLRSIPELPEECRLLMDCAYEGNETQQMALDLGFIPVVPRHPNGAEPWQIKNAWYRRRNEVERRFRRLQGFRRIFICFDKLNLRFIAFIYFALIVEALCA